jgi:hypothetical protein
MSIECSNHIIPSVVVISTLSNLPIQTTPSINWYCTVRAKRSKSLLPSLIGLCDKALCWSQRGFGEAIKKLQNAWESRGLDSASLERLLCGSGAVAANHSRFDLFHSMIPRGLTERILKNIPILV